MVIWPCGCRELCCKTFARLRIEIPKLSAAFKIRELSAYGTLSQLAVVLCVLRVLAWTVQRIAQKEGRQRRRRRSS
jgi:flagellar biogenesis protein FliO